MSLSLIDINIQKVWGGGGWGDVNVQCIASPEDVVALIFVCAYKCFQNRIVDVKSKKPHVHFAHGSLVEYDILCNSEKHKN